MSPVKAASVLSIPSFGVAFAAPSQALATAELLAAATLALVFGVVFGMRARTALEGARGGAMGAMLGVAAGHAIAVGVGAVGVERLFPALLLAFIAGAAGGIAGGSFKPAKARKCLVSL